jgi:hypothetical protein
MATKLKVILTKDHTAVSSLRVEGLRVVHIRPTPKRKWFSQQAIYVTPCEVHDERTPAVPVDTVHWDPVSRKATSLGPHKFCVLCWTPLEKLP